MQLFLAKMADWNQRMNGIPRKCLLIAITLLSAWLLVTLLPYFWPFVVGLLFSLLLEPFVRLISGWLQKAKMARNIATMLGMLVLFGLLGMVLVITVNRLWRELLSLRASIPELIRWVNGTAVPWIQNLYREYQNVLPDYFQSVLNDLIASISKTVAGLASTLTSWVTVGAWRSAMSIVDVVLSVVLTIMGTYYLTADKERIAAFFRRTFPQDVRTHSTLIKTNLFHSLFGQIKSQLSVSMIIVLFLTGTFLIFRVRYGLLLGLLIGVLDALPVVGAGLFLIPLSVIGFVSGDVFTGVFMACAYVGIIVIRQVLEPRIVGRNLGLYPLATMIAMYAGYRMMGAVGLLAGPVLLSLVRAVLDADRTNGVPLPPPLAAAEPPREEAPAAPGETRPASAEAGAKPPAAPPKGEMPKADGELTLSNGTRRPFKVRGKKEGF